MYIYVYIFYIYIYESLQSCLHSIQNDHVISEDTQHSRLNNMYKIYFCSPLIKVKKIPDVQQPTALMASS